MFGKKTAEDVLKLINSLSDDEKAKLMERIGASEETASPDDAGETPEEAAAEDTDTASEENTEEGDEAEETPSEESAEGNAEEIPDEAPTETAEEVSEESPENTPEDTDGEENTAEAIKALSDKFDALQESIGIRLASVEEFVESLKNEDNRQLDAMGLQRMENAQRAGRESYLDLRKRTIGE
ncbi:MAG: hypothetical protein IJX39_08755 [Clostridia bacterium]|nr:hypothetical protein [Clostridia bacterium]